MDAIAPSQVIAQARGWLGTPFAHQGRALGAGVDCIGLVIGVGRALGALPADFDYTDYGRNPLNNVLQRECERHLLAIAAPEPGCVILMRWFSEPQHCAIFSGESLIHSFSAVGRVVEHGYDAKWQRRARAFYRYPGVG